MTMSTVVAITEAKTAALEFIIAAMIMKIAKTIAKTIAMNIMMIIATTRAITDNTNASESINGNSKSSCEYNNNGNATTVTFIIAIAKTPITRIAGRMTIERQQ